MVTYSLLEAKQISDHLLDNEEIAEINQVSAQRFTISTNAVLTKTKGMSRPWWLVAIAIAVLVVAAGVMTVTGSKSMPVAVATSSGPAWLETLDAQAIETLVSDGSLTADGNRFVEVKRIELGGYLSILANQSLAAETKLVRIDLVSQDGGWEIEKWVKLD